MSRASRPNPCGFSEDAPFRSDYASAKNNKDRSRSEMRFDTHSSRLSPPRSSAELSTNYDLPSKPRRDESLDPHDISRDASLRYDYASSNKQLAIHTIIFLLYFSFMNIQINKHLVTPTSEQINDSLCVYAINIFFQPKTKITNKEK